MNTSPITQWDGAEAYFTFANSGFGTGLCLLLSMAVVVGAIWYGTHHETKDMERARGKV